MTQLNVLAACHLRKEGDGITRTFFPGVYEEEVSGSTTTAVKHYTFNGMTIAVRRGGTLRYTHTDHLGSSSGQTDANGNAVTDSYLRYYAYGSLRSGNLSASTTDRTFTGQKQDGTGLHYYNARYYDSALGVFLSPDTLVPDAGVVIDYNRFLYVRANPLKYTDPSGHCALLDDGTRSAEDSDCWAKADEIYNLWPGNADWLIKRFGTKTRDEWMEIYGGNPGIDTAYLQGHYDALWYDFYRGTGAYNEVYNLPPVMNPMPPQPLPMTPGAHIAKTLVRDIVQCSGDFPMGCATAADDAALVVASIGVLVCASATGGTCLGVVGGASTFLGGTGAAITTRNAVNSDATWIDATVSWGTTFVGGAFGGKLEGIVGATISLGQRIYDEWSSR